MKLRPIPFVVLLVILLMVFVYQWDRKVPVENEAKLLSYVSEKEGQSIPAFNKIIEKDGFYVVTYPVGEAQAIMVFKKAWVGFRYFGSGKTEVPISTYNYNEANEKSLVILYGDNSKLKAYGYELTVDTHVFTKENLDPYLLELYWIEPSASAYSECWLYDVNREALYEF